MAVKLKCVSLYQNLAAGLVYEPGVVFEVDDDMALFLRTDAPGCFEPVVEPAEPAPEKQTTAVAEPADDEPAPKSRRRPRAKSG